MKKVNNISIHKEIMRRIEEYKCFIPYFMIGRQIGKYLGIEHYHERVGRAAPGAKISVHQNQRLEPE